jgi:UDP-2,4-diacetamido-2,4,6-trideoxy-beta-L-altropyranose hydrolase
MTSKGASRLKVVFRADASILIGTGHIMRCLTLAKALREKGMVCSFICREHPGNLIQFIIDQGFEVGQIKMEVNQYSAGPADVHSLAHSDWLGVDWMTDAKDTAKFISGQVIDWLVVDHYALDSDWETFLRSNCKQLMAIDDLADRLHNCDLLLDQNLGRRSIDYERLLSVHAATLIGPQYALLRPEFARVRVQSINRRMRQPELKHLLITMGGVDKNNVTGLVIDGLKFCSLPSDMKISVVMGVHAPHLDQVRKKIIGIGCDTQVLIGVNDMAQLMADSDFAIGAAGSTSWERCCLGLPAMQLILAQNQSGIANALANIGAALLIDVNSLKNSLKKFFENDFTLPRLLTMGSIASSVVDGLGVYRVVDKMLEFNQ